MPTVRDAVAALDAIAPPSLCLGDDPRGLLVGDPDAALTGIVAALDVTLPVARSAAAAGASLVVAHHPLIYRPARNVRADDPFPGRVVWECARAGLSVACAHTNWDVAPGGVNDVLGALLGLSDLRPLRRTAETALVKVVVFVPHAHAEAVIDAMAAAGAGALGDYDRCAFAAAGEGTFRPRDGARPFVGTVGVPERVAESRIEMIAPRDRWTAVIDAARAAHPYEEMAFDVVPLLNGADARGIGRIGTLETAMEPSAFLDRVRAALAFDAVRAAPTSGRAIRRVAVCGGAGAELMADAVAAGADALVTADVRHHEFVDAHARDFLLVDAGHAQTESPGARALGRRLADALPGVPVRFATPDGTLEGV